MVPPAQDKRKLESLSFQAAQRPRDVVRKHPQAHAAALLDAQKYSRKTVSLLYVLLPSGQIPLLLPYIRGNENSLRKKVKPSRSEK
jgi:hypothetical protein